MSAYSKLPRELAHTEQDKTLGERLADARDECLAQLRVFVAFDVLCVALWCAVVLLPPAVFASRGLNNQTQLFGNSPASAMFLLIVTSSAPLAVSVWRVVSALRVRSLTLRVDRLANAPRKLRQLAYSADDPSLMWWFWCGYLLSSAVCLFNVAVLLVWEVLAGVSMVLALFILTLTLSWTACLHTCTARFYRIGVQRVFDVHVGNRVLVRKEWAAVCANEHRMRWFQNRPLLPTTLGVGIGGSEISAHVL